MDQNWNLLTWVYPVFIGFKEETPGSVLSVFDPLSSLILILVLNFLGLAPGGAERQT